MTTHLFDFITPKHPTAAELREECIAYHQFVEREAAKRFIVRDDCGSSRFATRQEAETFLRENKAILRNAFITSK